MIEVLCACGKRIQVQDEFIGLSIKCPKCRKLVVAVAAAPAADAMAETVAPSGLVTAPGLGETLPPPGVGAGLVAAASAGRPAPAGADSLAAAVERLTAVCRNIRVLLAAVLGVLAVQVLVTLFRR